MTVETYSSDTMYDILLQKPSLVDGDFIYQFFEPNEAVEENKKPNIVYDSPKKQKTSSKVTSEKIVQNPITTIALNASINTLKLMSLNPTINFGQTVSDPRPSFAMPITNPPETFAKVRQKEPDNSAITNAKRFAPRYTTLEIKNNALATDKQNMVQTVRDNLDLIYSSEDIGNSKISTLITHDTSADTRLYRAIRRAASLRGLVGNLTDISLDLSQLLSDDIDKDLLNDLAVNYAEQGAQYFADDGLLEEKDISSDVIKPKNILVNDRLLNTLVESGERSSITTSTPSTSLISRRAKEIQQRARASLGQNSESNFATILTPFKVSKASTNAIHEKVFNVATLLYRKEIFADGSSEVRLIDVFAPSITKITDFEVKLGTVYQYWAHSVYEVESSAVDDETGEAVVASLLFQSAPSESITIETFDKEPPPHPADFQLRWDYSSSALVLSWAMPTNPTRDIKYFQVFRRRSIQEPFELLVEYDFNDSLILPARSEGVLDENVIKMDSPLTVFIDKRFRRTSNFIYAVASVDARGLVSNYSMQLQATFNQNRNRLNVVQVSPPGAPRPYPNAFVSKELFLDSIITTNRKRAKVYFDPEYLKIHDRDDNDLGLLLTERKGKYVMSIIDADRSQADMVEIMIKDEREV